MRRLFALSGCLLASWWGLATLAPAQDSGLTEDEVRGIVQSVLQDERADGSSGGWKVGTKNRLTLESPDGRFNYRVGGRIQQHWTAWSADDEFAAAGAPLEDSTFLRRARLYVSGLLYGNVYFKAQYDLASSSVKAADVYLELREFDWGTIRAGHFKEPFGLDELTSSNDSTFVERSGNSSLALGRNAGVMVHDRYHDERGTWAVGAFRTTDDNARVEADGHLAYTGRATYLPLYEDDGQRLIHVGVAASLRDPDDSTVSYDSEPEARRASDVLDTGTIMADSVVLYGVEFGGVLDSFSWQAEYINAMNDVDGPGGDADFSHYYAQLSYVITGETRSYSRSKGAFGSVKPSENFGEDGGLGALEAAIRYTSQDYEDGSIDGGTMDQVTFGLNWYLNPNVRVMANVVLIDVDSIAGSSLDGEAEAFTMRFQLTF